MIGLEALIYNMSKFTILTNFKIMFYYTHYYGIRFNRTRAAPQSPAAASGIPVEPV